MNNFKLKVSLLALALFVLVPQASLAYFTTDQKAIQLNSDTILYTVTYKFGFPSSGLTMPIGAARDLKFMDQSFRVGYEVLNNGEAIADGSSYGIVLSDAKVVDNKYYVPKGSGATFTLVTLLKLSEGVKTGSEDGVNLTLRVTSLPFVMNKKEGRETNNLNLQLNPSELHYYTTPEISLK